MRQTHVNVRKTFKTKSGVNQMWSLKNSKEHLANLKAENVYQINSIKTYDFSTLYTTSPHDELKLKVLSSLTTFSLTKWEKEIFISSDQSSETLLC
jgi:hypothetical protein